MTVPELQAKRDEILQNIGTLRQQFGERSVEFSDAAKALALIDAEISKSNAQTNGNTPRTSFATFTKS